MHAIVTELAHASIVGVRFHNYADRWPCAVRGVLSVDDDGVLTFFDLEGRVVGVVSSFERDDVLEVVEGDTPFVAVGGKAWLYADGADADYIYELTKR